MELDNDRKQDHGDPGVAQDALSKAIRAARSAGELLRQNLNKAKRINSQQQHDIKLELDVRCQKRLERMLRSRGIAVLGEEGNSGSERAERRWVIDPIDGTVNFTYGIPHACVSIALQELRREPVREGEHPDKAYETTVGVVYDPFCDELWTAIHGEAARMNGRKIRVSGRGRLDSAIVSIGFAKNAASLEAMLPTFNHLVPRVRKIRMMGAAALAMVYVASGRFDAYVESGIRLWDIAAGGLILEMAGGEFWRTPLAGDHTYRVVANNGLLRRRLEKAVQS